MTRTLILLLAAIILSNSLSAAPLKVYVLVGQSNMEGHASLNVLDYIGEFPETAPMLKKVKSPEGEYKEIPNTWISFFTNEKATKGNREIHGPLTAGYGSRGGSNFEKIGTKIGPELGFGLTIQEAVKQSVLIIKVAWGGQSLNKNLRSPSSGPYVPTESNAKQFETEEAKKKLEETVGKRYREMIAHVNAVLKNPGRVVPNYNEKEGYELEGFVWFQGWNDLVDRGTYPNRDKEGGYDNYSKWMANFIRDVRKDLKSPKLPFVIGVMGVNGPIDNVSPRYRKIHGNFREAMAAPASMPEFKGNVFAVRTAPYWDMEIDAISKKRAEVGNKARMLRSKHKDHENAEGKMTPKEMKEFLAAFEKKILTPEEIAKEKRGKSNAEYHYMGSAKTMMLIGKAFAEALANQND